MPAAAATVKAAPNPASRHHVFRPDDGTLLYRQLDNFSLKHRVMFDWLDEVLDQRWPGPALPTPENGASLGDGLVRDVWTGCPERESVPAN